MYPLEFVQLVLPECQWARLEGTNQLVGGKKLANKCLRRAFKPSCEHRQD